MQPNKGGTKMMMKDIFKMNLDPRYLGVIWFIASLILDNVNDLMMKYVGSEIGAQQIIFMRFLSSTLILLPFVLHQRRQGSGTPKTSITLHVLRSFLLYIGMVLWCFGLCRVPMATATSINFTIPIFILIFARFFLKEKMTFGKIMATALGFLGTLVVIDRWHWGSGQNGWMTHMGGVESLLISAMLFALLDVINKRFVHQESNIDMLFYSGFFVTLFSAVPASISWVSPSLSSLISLGVLGVTGNMILYCLLRAFSHVDISSVAPYRYVELIISSYFGYIFFSEIPRTTTYIGSMLIAVSTLIVLYEERIKTWFGRGKTALSP
jgi:S-adenosylmethionine uptake transporter